jgi:hypothetical protein
MNNTDIYIDPIEAGRKRAAVRRKRLLFRFLFLIILASAIMTVLGIYSSFYGMKGKFWEISETFAWWGLLATIVGFWLYNNWYGYRMSKEEEDYMFNPLYSGWSDNVFHRRDSDNS